MDELDRKPARAGSAFVGGLLAGLFAVSAWFLFFLTALSLGTFLQPMRSWVNLWGCIIVSALLMALFLRWTPVKNSFSSFSTEPDRPKTRELSFLCGSMGLLALACAVVVSGVHARWHRKAAAAKQALKVQGFPVTVADFQESIPDEMYAYPAVSKIIEEDFDADYYGKVKHSFERFSRWTPERARKEAEAAAHYAPYFEKQLIPALRKKYIRYMKADYAAAPKNPLKTPAPRLGKFSPIAMMATSYAVSRALQGDMGKAWDAVRLQLDLSDLLRSEKTLIAGVVSSLLRGDAANSAASILLSRPGSALPKDVSDRLLEAWSDRPVIDGLRGELAYQLDLFRFFERLRFRRFKSMGGLPGTLLWGPEARESGPALWFHYGILSLLRRIGILDMNCMAAAGCLSTIAAPGSWAQTSANVQEAVNRIDALPTWPFFLAKLSMMSSPRLLVGDFETRARAGMTWTLSELGRYRQARGRYPTRLPDLKLKEPVLDPFTDQEFAYSQTPDGRGFELCSAGSRGDRKTDSGESLCLLNPSAAAPADSAAPIAGRSPRR